MEKKLSDILFLLLSIVMSLVGLYFYHQQYLCYYYTPLLFILGVVVCLGSSLLSVPIHRQKTDSKKKIALKALLTALVVAIVLIVSMLLINLIIGNGELEKPALIIPVYITFIITTILALVSILKFSAKKQLNQYSRYWFLQALLLAVVHIFPLRYLKRFQILRIYRLAKSED